MMKWLSFSFIHSHIKWILILGGIWNLALGLMGFLLPEVTLDICTVMDKQLPAVKLFAGLFFAAVAIFGLGYIWTSLNPIRYYPILVLGILGKWIVFVTFTIAAYKSYVNMLPFLAGSVDLFLSLLFTLFLIGQRKSIRQYGQ